MYIIVGLGNPGEEYTHTRHNVGRMAEDYLSPLIKKKVKFIFPDVFINKSGSAIAKVAKSKLAAKKLVVIHDDLDLPLGVIKISYGRGSGGHRGIRSIIRSLKTEEFIRVRIGITPTTPSGKLKKPKGDKAVLDFILGKFKSSEDKILKGIFKTTAEIVQTIVSEGKEVAMNKFN